MRKCAPLVRVDVRQCVFSRMLVDMDGTSDPHHGHGDAHAHDHEPVTLMSTVTVTATATATATGLR